VGIILWAGYYAFERDMERVVKHYADMGVKGFKVDFMDRDDQRMVDFLHRDVRGDLWFAAIENGVGNRVHFLKDFLFGKCR